MIKELNKLRDLCLQELEQRHYSDFHRMRLSRNWELLDKWMKEHSIDEFDGQVARRYCEEKLGSYLFKAGWPYRTRVALRAIRKLATFQESGSFEFRSPKADHSLTGPLSAAGNEFLRYLAIELKRSKSVISMRKYHLHRFFQFIGDKEGLPSSLEGGDFDSFLKSEDAHKGGVAAYCLSLRQFLRFLHDKGYVKKDLSAFVPHIPQRRGNKLPTTYTEEEITKLLSVVERGSPIGKRDYLILLLASEYGLRASDIRTLSFADIDWDRNTITHKMKKTGEFVVLPLLAKVGNAIYDYLGEEGRPDTDCKFIVVSHNLETLGQPLTSPTLHSVVSKYMKEAGIKDWQKKRHGTHSLRHSLAARMQSRNTSTPVISAVLGHQSTDATGVYLKVDIPRLTQCPLPMPPLESPYYTPEGGHGKV